MTVMSSVCTLSYLDTVTVPQWPPSPHLVTPVVTCHVSRVSKIMCPVYQWRHVSVMPTCQVSVMSRVTCTKDVTRQICQWCPRVTCQWCHVSHMPVMSPCRSLICLLAAWGHGLPSYGRGGDGDNRDQWSVGSILYTRAKIKSLSIKHKLGSGSE